MIPGLNSYTIDNNTHVWIENVHPVTLKLWNMLFLAVQTSLLRARAHTKCLQWHVYFKRLQMQWHTVKSVGKRP